MPANPCLSCGACCAFYRASFYWGESNFYKPDGVPADLTDQLTPHHLVMKGTNQPQPRCIALEGTIGASVKCNIHPVRSSTCREFPASYEDGVTANERCDKARIAHRLRPLVPEDWRDTPPDMPPIEAA